MKEGRKQEYLEKTPDDEPQKMPHSQAQKFMETWTHSLALVAGEESRRANHYTSGGHHTLHAFIRTLIHNYVYDIH